MDKEIIRFKTTGTEEIHVSIGTLHESLDKKFLFLRVWVESAGEMVETKRGVAIPLDKAGFLKAALEQIGL
jgi:hypothetical protein